MPLQHLDIGLAFDQQEDPDPAARAIGHGSF
jgi:hypothetical protein